MSQEQLDILQRALARERAARKQAEKILEEKSAELYQVNKKLEESHTELMSLYDKTNSQLQGVFENIVDAYVIMDLWGNILKMNDAAVKLLGFNDVKTNSNLMELVDPKEIEKVATSFKTLMEKGVITNFKVKIVTKTGEKKLAHINASVIYEKGIAVGAQGIVRDITVESDYQKSIEAERQKYMSIIDNMNLGLVEVNNEDEIQFVNQQFTEISGYSKDELIGQVGGQLFPVDKDKDIIVLENEKRLKGKSNSYEIEVNTKSGEKRFWLISGAPNYDISGYVTGSIGIHLDITDAKRNTELIQEQKRELDVIINNSSIGIVLTQYGDILKTNATFQDLLGYSESQLNEFSIKDLSFEEDYPESKYYIDKMNLGEIDNFTVNKRYKKRNGSVIWAKTNVNAVRDNDGNIKFQVALIEDITSERERTLIIDMINNLTKSILGKTDVNEIAWEIVNNIAEYLDSEDCVIYLVDHNNNTLEQIAVYGEKLDEDNKIRNKLTVPIGEGIVGSVVKSGISEIIKNTSKDKRYIVDDKQRFSEITVPIISEGRVIGVIDSEHKDKNYYTQEHAKALESVASLVAIQLRTAINIRERKKAESKNEHLLLELAKSNDELQEYAHIVSHDLKSPLRSIEALVSWIKADNSGKFDDVSLQNFDLIATTLEKMEQLISDILTYSSIGSETQEEQEVDLNVLIDELKQILYVPDHVSINVLNTLPTVKGDKTKLQQLFQNLISNAIKFNDKDSGVVNINVEEKKSFYQFSIQDNGVGIDKKYHDKIFKIFHSLNSSKESTGIGLSIVKKIIDLFKGEIWIESEKGKGTTFHFTLKKS
ncbi:PAS domain S-box protein [uncultured Psychroserpens sp.]|uniref:PAS domain S-box protein n=1 Tax=uncultured Psychroserpens sp. TaxID=255436 RepID=UPI0026074414|nr:PAS domain S-box protein [uncultured Psychroserpens sp.]